MSGEEAREGCGVVGGGGLNPLSEFTLAVTMVPSPSSQKIHHTHTRLEYFHFESQHITSYHAKELLYELV